MSFYSWLTMAESGFRNPRLLIPMLLLSSAAILTGLGRVLLDGWLIAIVCALGFLLVLLLVFLVWSLVARERERSLQAGLEATPAKAAEPEVPTTRMHAEALEDKFVRGLADWGRRGEARTLPWYLVLGESGAGKTLALSESGLELPADTSRFVEPGPTQNFAWWPTNDGILIDTAGRYVDDEDLDTRREWRGLLRLIRRHGRSVPLQGVIVAVSLRSLLSADEAVLQAKAHRLRRRINEIATDLRIDTPIYVIVTHIDAVEGLVEFVKGLPHARRDEAIGWTNPYRRYSEPSVLLRKGFASTLERLELLLPGILVREQDPAVRRRLVLVASELEAAIGRVGAFLDLCFGRSVYGSIPFLRGVYLASTVQHGMTQSERLERWGHAWAAHAVDEFRPQRAVFLRDLFTQIIVDPEETSLATRARELSPAMRRSVLGVAGLASAAALVLISMSFRLNWVALREVRNDLIPAQVQRPTLATLDALRETLARVEAPFDAGWRRMGLTYPLFAVVDRAGETLASRFEAVYETPTKARMKRQADQLDERAFAALSALALDVAWLGREPDGQATPDLSRFLECRDCGDEGASARFGRVYAAWRQFAPERATARIEDERRVLQRATPTLLQLDNVDRWCRAESESCQDVRFEAFGLTTPTNCAPVSGVYTQVTWDRLISQLVAAVEASGQASSVDVERFLRDYQRGYAREWEAFVSCLPLSARAEVPEQSMYLRVLRTLAVNTVEGTQWSQRVPPPEWFGVVQELARTEPLTEGEDPPGLQYQRYLEELTSEVRRVKTQPGAAISAVQEVGAKPENPYQNGLTLVEKLVPLEPSSERSVRRKLRSLLEMPILNGFSVVAGAAQGVIDEQWRESISGPYSGPLNDLASLRALYSPEGGALTKFEAQWLQPFLRGDRAPALLRDRGIGFGDAFRRWLASARELRSGYFGSEMRTLRVVSKPGSTDGGGNLFLTERSLSLECPDGVQSFEHADAGQAREFSFRWSPSCDVVRLKLVAQRPGFPVQTLPERTWTGPFAMVRFLREARRRGSEFEWTLSFEGGLTVKMPYTISGANAVTQFDHRPPPRSIRQ